MFVSPLNKSVCKIIKVRQVVNPVYESVIGNHSKRAGKQSFNVSSQKHGVTRSLNVKNILMTSLYTYESAIFFFIFHQNFSNDFLNVTPRVTTSLGILFWILIVLFIMTSTMSTFHITQMFYLLSSFLSFLFLFLRIFLFYVQSF